MKKRVITIQPKCLNYDQVSEIYGIPKGTLYAMVNQKTIPHIRLGKRHVKFSVEKLDAWIKDCTVQIK